MAIKCYHCRNRKGSGYHDTIAEVRACADATREAAQSRFSGLSERQQGYLIDLLSQLHVELNDGATPLTISYRDGRPLITALAAVRRKRAYGQPADLPPGVRPLTNPPSSRAERYSTQPSMPVVEPGYYALPAKMLDYDGNDIYFYRVKQGKQRIFVNQIVGGRPEYGMRIPETRKVLKAILAFGVEDAGVLFGLELKQCRNCGTHLTKWASRTLLYGPDCAVQKDLGDDWKALDAKARAEGLDDEDDSE